MSLPAQYAQATRIIDDAITRLDHPQERARMAYMLARAAILRVRAERGAVAAAEVAYGLADEMTGGD